MPPPFISPDSKGHVGPIVDATDLSQKAVRVVLPGCTLLDGSGNAAELWPDALVTSGGIDGTNPRLRVDVGQTGFFAGREFRTFKELNIAASTTYVVRVVVPINVILFGFLAAIESGHLRMDVAAGGTPGGSFSETLPVIPRNGMTERPTPFYTPQVVITAGGTHTGGTVTDVLRLKAANNTNQATSVGSVEGDERGVSANTYYFRLENLSATDAIVGTMAVRWEERP